MIGSSRQYLVAAQVAERLVNLVRRPKPLDRQLRALELGELTLDKAILRLMNRLLRRVQAAVLVLRLLVLLLFFDLKSTANTPAGIIARCLRLYRSGRQVEAA